MSEDQMTKLTKTLEKRFDKIDERFDRVDKRFDNVDKKLTGHDNSFERFFKYMEEMRSEMSARFDENAREHAEIRGAIADLGGQIRDYHQEMIMLARKVDRMERWIHEIAEKTGVKLSYD